MRSRAIYGCLGTVLTAEEKQFFRDVAPWGFILFARNLDTPEQVLALTQSLRETVGDGSAPVLIDQEGGRVARIGPPHWREYPPAALFGRLHETSPEKAQEAVYLGARLIAQELIGIGVSVDCLPVLDVPAEGAHRIIGDRAFSSDPARVIALGKAQIDGLLDGGVLPVMKHIPGHGRAAVDSHLALPRVSASIAELSATDFVTFRSLNDCPMAMTAHVVYDAVDPVRPATTSPKVIRDVIRHEIGFDGLLMSDDISMKALDGPVSRRVRSALFAGCDIVLHCNGEMAEMVEVASEVGPLEGDCLRRVQRVSAKLTRPMEFDVAAGVDRFQELMGMG